MSWPFEFDASFLLSLNLVLGQNSLKVKASVGLDFISFSFLSASSLLDDSLCSSFQCQWKKRYVDCELDVLDDVLTLCAATAINGITPLLLGRV